MAKRDPNKTARNKIVANIKEELRDMLPQVLLETGARTEASLNAKIGSKADRFFDLKNDVIRSQEEYVNIWLQGFKKEADEGDSVAIAWLERSIRASDEFKRYLILFLKRSYLKHYESLSKTRPKVEQSVLWIGQSNAEYGLLVTPRFRNSQWENDKSEIRAFSEGYFTIGHVLETGLVIPSRKRKFTFSDVDQYLMFFRDLFVRNSGSQYEYEIADFYCDYVQAHSSPTDVPLLIPEYRYLGIKKKHKYRLDFLVINPFTLDRVGFELSPWSTHGHLSKTKSLTQKQINQMANDNFQKEMKKHRSYFRKHDVFTLIYTDDQLADCEQLFNDDIRPYLEPQQPMTQLSFQIMEDFFT